MNPNMPGIVGGIVICAAGALGNMAMAAGKRRMTGTIVGTKLGGQEKLKGKFIDVTAGFDMDFSCGVK